MTPFAKGVVALALAGALTASAASTASARSWKPWAAAGAGFAAGAIVGSALTAPRYGYAYGPAYSSYAYGPAYSSYAYGPAYSSYAYSPAYSSYAYSPAYSSYAYAPGYASAPAYDSAYGAYAYAPGVTYQAPIVMPRYGGYGLDADYRGCATRGNYGGKTDYGAC